jgi:hypothetical protein
MRSANNARAAGSSVGGSEALISAILDADALEGWAVGPEDSLAADADKINAA